MPIISGANILNSYGGATTLQQVVGAAVVGSNVNLTYVCPISQTLHGLGTATFVQHGEIRVFGFVGEYLINISRRVANQVLVPPESGMYVGEDRIEIVQGASPGTIGFWVKNVAINEYYSVSIVVRDSPLGVIVPAIAGRTTTRLN